MRCIKLQTKLLQTYQLMLQTTNSTPSTERNRLTNYHVRQKNCC